MWAGALVGVAALVAAAKAHGRQVRLEREAAGYHEVVFGGDNPEFVRRLWRGDRIRYWSATPLAALLLAAFAWLARADAPLALAAALLGGPIVGFFFAGLASFARERGRGGAGWWALAATLAVAATLLALV